MRPHWPNVLHNDVHNFENALYTTTKPERQKGRTENTKFIRSLARRTFEAFMTVYDPLEKSVEMDTMLFTTPFIRHDACTGSGGKSCVGLTRGEDWALQTIQRARVLCARNADQAMCADCARRGEQEANVHSSAFDFDESVCALCGDLVPIQFGGPHTNMGGPDFVVHADCWRRAERMIAQCVEEEGSEATNGLICDRVALKLINLQPQLVGYARPLPTLAEPERFGVDGYVECLPTDRVCTVAFYATRVFRSQQVPASEEECRSFWNVNNIAYLARRVAADNSLLMDSGDLYIAPDYFLRVGPWDSGFIDTRRFSRRKNKENTRKSFPGMAQLVVAANTIMCERSLSHICIVFDTIYQAGPVSVLLELVASLKHTERCSLVFRHVGFGLDPNCVLNDTSAVRVPALALAEALVGAHVAPNSYSELILADVVAYRTMSDRDKKMTRRVLPNVNDSFESTFDDSPRATDVEARSVDSPKKDFMSTKTHDANEQSAFDRKVFLLSAKNGAVQSRLVHDQHVLRHVFTSTAKDRVIQAFPDKTQTNAAAQKEVEDETPNQEGIALAGPLDRFNAPNPPGVRGTLPLHVGKIAAQAPRQALQALLAYLAKEIDAAFLEGCGIDVQALAIASRTDRGT